MQTSLRLRLPFVAALLLAPAIVLGASKVGPSQPDRAAGLPPTLSAQANYGNLPLAFEPNAGQVDPQVRFLTHSRGMTVFFTDNEAVMVLHRREKSDPHRLRGQEAHTKPEMAVVRMKLAGAGKPGQTVGLDKLPGISNYFIGNDPAKWRTNIPNYARIQYKGVYPGVDLVCYGKERQLEYDLVVAPGADPSQIELAWEGVDRLQLNADGDMVLTTRLGDVVQKRPRVYQMIGGRRVEVAANYILGAASGLSGAKGRRHASTVKFELARYDRSRPLVIDPVTVAYGTYLGYSEQGTTIAVDSSGAAYVAGFTYDTVFPKFPTTAGAYQTTNNDTNCSNATTFVTKFTPAGSSLVYSTFLGGTCEDDPAGIAVDGSGYAYIAGTAGSTDFPTQATYSAYQKTCPNDIPGGQYGGVYVTKLSTAGNSLVYSTYLCGGYSDHAGGIAVDSTGYAYVTGDTSSDHWPLAGSPVYQSQLNGDTDAFVTKLTPTGTPVYSTYLGGGNEDFGTGIAIDSTGAAYITGNTNSTDFPKQNAYQSVNKASYGNPTAFVTKLSPSGSSLTYSTYLGGHSSYQVGDMATGIAVDAGASAVITGYTGSSDFPIHNQVQATNKNTDSGTCFVTKFAADGGSLLYSTYLGGSATLVESGDFCYAIATSSAKETYVTGMTWSPDFPLLSQFPRSHPGAGHNTVFVTKYAADYTMAYSTFLTSGDADGYGIAVDSAGAAYITGDAGDNDDFPLQNAFQTTTGPSGGPFVAKLQLASSSSTLVTTNPAGLPFTVDGTSYTTAQTFTWTAGSSHTISVNSPLAGSTGTRYVFANWSDSGAQSHTITASSSGGAYTANFNTQYLLTLAISPATGGSVISTPSNGDQVTGYYNSGATITLTETPNSGYSFTGWSGDASGTSSSTSVTMIGPKSVTANFGVPTALPDLVITSFTAQTTATAGGQITILNLTVVNQGNGDAGPVKAGYYFSPTPTINIATAMDTTFYCNFTNGIAAGTTHFCAGAAVRVPSTLTSGTWYLGAIVDPTNQITESNKNNNTRVADSGPVTITGGVSGLYFYPVAPCRVADTRNANGTFGGPIMSGGSTRTFPVTQSSCGIPSTAQAYSLNATVVPPAAMGWLTLWPTGQSQASVSTLNSYQGRVVANAAIVPAGSGGSINAYVSDTSHLILDINGYFAAPGTGGLGFWPLTPCRVADTRNANGPFGGPIMSAGSTRSFEIPLSSCMVPTNAQAYSVNITVVPSGSLSYLTTWPAGQGQPNVSTLNSYDGRVVANAAIVPAGPWNLRGAINVYVTNTTHVIIDINGYFAPLTGTLSFYPATPCRVADTRNSNGMFGGPSLSGNETRGFPIPQSACAIPSNAQAYSVNMTVLPTGYLGYLSTWPVGLGQPNVSTLNSYDGTVVANAALVPAGTDGATNVFVTNPTQVIIDINGFFAP